MTTNKPTCSCNFFKANGYCSAHPTPLENWEEFKNRWVFLQTMHVDAGALFKDVEALLTQAQELGRRQGVEEVINDVYPLTEEMLQIPTATEDYRDATILIQARLMNTKSKLLTNPL